MTGMTIAAKDVAELRARTGAGMMDCKKALEEAGGDLSRAAEILRARGISKAEKRAGRSASQGLVAGAVTGDGTAGGLLELTCETDFVARTEDFSRTAGTLLAGLLAADPMDLSGFLDLPVAGAGGKTVREVVTEGSTRTGEKVELRNARKVAPGPRGVVGLYLHHNRLVGVLVELTAGSEAVARSAAAADLARELAIHVASADPLAVRKEDIPADVLDRERRIAEEQVAGEGKPEAVRPKIVEGKLRKFVAERALLEQAWVKDDKRTVGQLVQESAKAAGGPLTIVGFSRFKVGEA
jgi:elongation factor Ts